MEVPRKLTGHVSERTLDAVAGAVDEAESMTSGEIVVRIVHGLLPLEKARPRAIRAFRELGCHETRLRNAVLLFVIMKKRRFEIVADEGIEARVERETWEELASWIGREIQRLGFERGLCAGVRRIGRVLAEHFPRAPGDEDENELADRPTAGDS
jgi:uncharacterized membrane protein